jgi:hypothetical protein
MPNCAKPARFGQRYCMECHRKYMQTWRAKRKRREAELKQSVIKLRKRVVDLEQENRELKAQYGE